MSNMYDDSFDDSCGDCDCWERGYLQAVADRERVDTHLPIIGCVVGVLIGMLTGGATVAAIWLW